MGSINNFDLLIKEAKQEFMLTAWAFTFWGIVGSVVPLMVLFLKYFSRNSLAAYASYPMVLFPVAAVVSGGIILFHSIKHPSKNPVSHILSFLWGITSFDVMVIAYGFYFLYGKLLIASLLLMISIAQSTCGFILKVRPLLFTGLLSQLLIGGYFLAITFLDSSYLKEMELDLLLLIVVSLLGQLLPGLLLRRHT